MEYKFVRRFERGDHPGSVSSNSTGRISGQTLQCCECSFFAIFVTSNLVEDFHATRRGFQLARLGGFLQFVYRKIALSHQQLMCRPSVTKLGTCQVLNGTCDIYRVAVLRSILTWQSL